MDLTEYEREREARIRKNQEALLKLEIPQLAPKQAVASKPRAPRSKRKPVEETTRRVSLRARGLAPDGTEAEKIKKEAELVAAQTRKRHSGTESFAGTLYEPDDYQDFDGDSDDSKRQNLVDSFAMKIRSSSGGVDERFSVGEDKKTGADRILDMKIIGEEPQRKVLVSRVYSVNIHPRKDRILVGAGDTKGFFGLMYLDDESRPSLLRMEPHSRTITAIRSNAVETDQMYTTSHDCTLRRLDLTRQEFITIREDAEGDGSTDFNFIEPRVLAYCTSRGYVGVVDTRDKKHPSWENQLHDKKIGSVSVCSKTNTLVTASNDCTVAVFDLRKVNRKSTLASFSHGRAVSNGVISENGQSILTTSYDDTLRIYSTVKGEARSADMRCPTAIH